MSGLSICEVQINWREFQIPCVGFADVHPLNCWMQQGV